MQPEGGGTGERDCGDDSEGTLSRGDQKSIQTDRVLLVPGPPEELENVAWIYHMFVVEKRVESEITQITAVAMGTANPSNPCRSVSGV